MPSISFAGVGSVTCPFWLIFHIRVSEPNKVCLLGVMSAGSMKHVCARNVTDLRSCIIVYETKMQNASIFI